MDTAKTASKRVVHKTAEATEDLIGNKIPDKITSIGKPKEKEKTNKVEEIYISPVKRQQIIDDLRLFWAQNMRPLHKNEFQKIANFLNATSDDKDLPRFVTKKRVEVLINQDKNTTQRNTPELRRQYSDQIYAILMTGILLWKEIILLIKTIYC